MSWSTEVYIGEMRPWPDTVHVIRGKTGEMRRYVPERTCDIELVHSGARYDKYRCSACGYEQAFGVSENLPPMNYCGNCGAKAVG